jgi:serine/threonine-protein kinase
VPSGAERRLSELAELARPSGRGLEWPWLLPRAGEPATMAGWCNGSCGHAFVWALAHRVYGGGPYLDLALGAAWSAWDSPEGTTTLCCGLAGRAYALLAVHRATGERVWLDRARDLALRGARQGGTASDYPHALYKGELGLAVLAADLEQPEEAVMPFFEPLGYRR